ncbi:PspC domain-containing protein [Bacteroides ilei]|jgi:phage shock protein PspC (stress-responsive transcriptional regulator)|uniref:PspC domain-containing protein n=1 Tax=Bacteroides ilei TaxID=1907658 RepID=UPI000931D47B|nr:PspC domain-containing protein [Bacteroides ilei]
MKKTLTVNLGGTVYHIDEDAYTLLDNYLNNLRYHFRKEEGADEIVRDMEVRIAELFDEYIRTGMQVITITQVEEVIARMGKPEDLDTDSDSGNASESARNGKTSYTTTGKRLFRDPDDRILGGVASGIAAYFGWNPTWVRLAMVVLELFFHGFFLIYLILWIVIPLAYTATEKLQMRGEPINMENIGKTVTDGFEKVNDYVRSDKPRSAITRFMNALVRVIGFIIKVILIIVAICCAPALLIALVVIFALLMAATGLIAAMPAVVYHVLPEVDWSMITVSDTAVIALAVCGIFAVGIPVVGLFQLIFQGFNVWKPMSTPVKITLILLWIIAVTVGLVIAFNTPFIVQSLYVI